MASIADQLIGTVSEGIQQTTGNIAQGAALAKSAQDVVDRRQQLELQKQQHEMSKIEKIAEWYETGAKMDPGPARNAFMNEFIPQGISALKPQTPINPIVQKMLSSDPLLAARLISEIRSGNIELSALTDPNAVGQLAQNLKQYGDEQTFKDTVQEYLPELKKANEFVTGEEGKAYRAKLAAEAALGKQKQGQEAAPEVEFNKKLADSAAAFVSKDKNDLQNTLDKAERSVETLVTGKVKLGGIVKGLIAKSPTIQASLDPNTKALIDDVRGLINMRLALSDPNPTKEQVDQVLGRIIDPALPNDKNIQKIRDYITKTRGELEAKQKLFIDKGFMKAEDKWNPSGGVKKYKVDGKEYTADQLKQILSKQPKAKGAIDPKVLKELGL